ncbi:DUF563 domain-containing protein [Pseudomonadota bacterium]
MGSRISRIHGVVAAVTSSTQWNYYHWLFDVLPRLSILEDFRMDYDHLYIQNNTRFQDQTLSLVRVDKNRLLDCDTLPIIQADVLQVPCHQSTGTKYYPMWVTERLRSWFLPHLDQSNDKRRIYIARSQKNGRCLANEHEILSFLTSTGFEYILPERLSFLDQVRAFRDAEVVVAPHGAGLANIVFCSAGTKVIELFPSDTKYTYYKISQTAGLDYYFVKAPGEQNRTMSRENFLIRLEDLQQTFKLAHIG